MGMTERMINGKFSVFGECMVCGLWTWFIEERVAHDGMLCGICDERGLHPKDVAPPPPDVTPAAVCAWDEGVEVDVGEGDAIANLYQHLASTQEPLGKEFEDVLHENLWDLLVRT